MMFENILPEGDLLKITNHRWGHVTLCDGIMTCEKCGEKMTSRRRPMSFKNHLYALQGFIMVHKKCKNPD